MPGNEVRRYGYYRCTSCRKAWESAWTFCRRSDKQPLYRQECKDCDVEVLPYRTEAIKCSHCGQIQCRCSWLEKEKRHADPNKPHRADLCQRCKSGRRCGGAY